MLSVNLINITIWRKNNNYNFLEEYMILFKNLNLQSNCLLKTKLLRIIIFRLLASSNKKAFNYKTTLLKQNKPRTILTLLMKMLKIQGINYEQVQWVSEEILDRLYLKIEITQLPARQDWVEMNQRINYQKKWVKDLAKQI